MTLDEVCRRRVGDVHRHGVKDDSIKRNARETVAAIAGWKCSVKLSSPSMEPIREIETGRLFVLPPAIVAAEHLDGTAEE